MAFSQSSLGKDGDKPAVSAETKEAYGDLKNDFAALREDLKQLRRDFSSLGSSSASEFRSTAKAGISAAEDKAHQVADYAATEFQEIQNQAQRAIRKNPLSAMAAALAIGYFLSGITRR